MPRPRKPTALLELSGAFKHDPQRRRDGEPRPTGPLGDPPERLPTEAVPYWHEIEATCAPGVLTISDRFAVELAARLMARAVAQPTPPDVLELIRRMKTKGEAAKRLKALLGQDGLSNGELRVLRGFLASFGMTPVDRSKLSVRVEKPKNPFDQFRKAGEELNRRPN